MRLSMLPNGRGAILICAVILAACQSAPGPSPDATPVVSVEATPVIVVTVGEPRPARESPTPMWGAPDADGGPGPGTPICFEVNPGDCGIVTPYTTGIQFPDRSQTLRR
jgi:hypothetical protein